MLSTGAWFSVCVMRGIWRCSLAVTLMFAQACTLGGTGIGMVASPPGQPPEVEVLVVRPGTLTRDRFLTQLDARLGSPIWVTHADGTRVTVGRYAGLAPDDGLKRVERRGSRRVVLVPRSAHGIRVRIDATVEVVPFEQVSGVRIEVPHPPYWAIGTGVGLLLDIAVVAAWVAWSPSDLICCD